MKEISLQHADVNTENENNAETATAARLKDGYNDHLRIQCFDKGELAQLLTERF